MRTASKKTELAQLTHLELISALTSAQRESLHEKSDSIGLGHLLIHWGAVALFATLIAREVWAWPALLPLQGILLVFLFTLLHESVHSTPFRSRWLNAVVGAVCGFILFLPSRWFRYFHFAHHRHTQDPERDPELATPKPENLRDYFIVLSGIPVLFSQFRGLILIASGKQKDNFVPGNAQSQVILEARIMLALYLLLLAVSLSTGSTLLFFIWILPLFLGQPFLRAYLMAEHTLCPQVRNMLLNTRTTFTNPIVRFIAWNMPYHAEHHAMPAVPFHKLPVLHEHMREHLGVTQNGYISFHRRLVREFAGSKNV